MAVEQGSEDFLTNLIKNSNVCFWYIELIKKLRTAKLKAYILCVDRYFHFKKNAGWIQIKVPPHIAIFLVLKFRFPRIKVHNQKHTFAGDLIFGPYSRF